ncbi:MAG: PLP-dependent aminotransferase family protein [Desulfobacteraceae bacterium]|nr:PLP-dependent aminotransferase family protein [Desulfobacteraceae bacterium]
MEKMNIKNNKTLYQSVEARVLEMIDSKTFRPGEKLPSIRALSRQLKVSISTVKTAYCHLEDKRIIEARPQSGFYVVPKLPEIPDDPEIKEPEINPLDITKGELVMKIMRDVLDPKKIQFGAAIPDPDLIPSARLSQMIGTQAKRHLSESVQYSMPPGSRRLRVQISKRLLKAGCTLNPDEILITTGATEAVFLALRSLCRPGDTIAVGTPLYFNFLRMIQELGLNIIEIPSSPREGLSIEALSMAVIQNKISACLVIANFNNPLGVTLSDERKTELVNLLDENNIPLIEDDINGDLSFTDDRPSVCKGYDRTGNVVLCSSFSKTIAPGYRVGWMAAGKYQKKIEQLKVITNIASAAPTQLAVAEFLTNGGYDHHLRSIRRIYSGKTARMAEAVGEFFPEGTKVTRPKGGFILWVELPKGTDSMKLYSECWKRNISIAPGSIFSATDQFRNCIRLNAAFWSEDKEDLIKEIGKLSHRCIF